MSHIAEIEIEIKDLECLKKASQKLGLNFIENKATYKWYGRSVGDYPLPKGFEQADLGKCDHALSIANPKDNRAYEVGIVKNKDGSQGYTLLWDFWNGGYGLEKLIGKNGVELKKEYSAQVAEKQIRRMGFRPIRTVENNKILIRGVK